MCQFLPSSSTSWTIGHPWGRPDPRLVGARPTPHRKGQWVVDSSVWVLLLFYLKDKPQRRAYILGSRMVAEFVSPPNVEAQRNEPIISRMLVGHKPETQKNCMTSCCLFAPSHELLQNLTSLYNQICKLRVRCRLWHNRISFRLSLTQSQVRVPPYIFLCSLTFSFHEQGLFLCLNTASLLQELWAPPKRGMGLKDSSLNHYFC